MIRLVYQRGEFTAADTTLVATALFWFAFSLPTNGVYLLQTRTFFSLQRPWHGDRARGDRPGRLGASRRWPSTSRSGSAGSSPAPASATTAAVFAQALILRREFGGLELAAALDRDPHLDRRGRPGRGQLGGLGPARHALGRGLVGQIVSLGAGLARRRRLPGRRQAAADRRARADPPPAAAAPLDARPRPIPAGRRRAPPARRLRLARRGAACGAGCCPSSSGAPALLATHVLALALLIWCAELLGTLRRFEPVPYLLLVVAASAAGLSGGWRRGWGGRGRPLDRPQAPLSRDGPARPMRDRPDADRAG